MRDLLLLLLLGGMVYAAWSWWREGRSGGIHPALLSAARGDRDLARRTLAYLRAKYPDKSAKWCREKAIYDLHRDHGSTSGGSRRRNPSTLSRQERRERRRRGVNWGVQAWRSCVQRWWRH